MTLTKANIVNLLREQLGLPKKDCLIIVNAYFEEISRPGRNPKTGESYKISDRNVVSFKASKKLRESL